MKAGKEATKTNKEWSVQKFNEKKMTSNFKIRTFKNCC